MRILGSQPYGISFSGLGGSDEAEDFVAAIRQIAFTEGKGDDNKWIVNLASASLTQNALRWHITLDPEIQNDWRLLQQAIFIRYPATNPSYDSFK